VRRRRRLIEAAASSRSPLDAGGPDPLMRSRCARLVAPGRSGEPFKKHQTVAGSRGAVCDALDWGSERADVMVVEGGIGRPALLSARARVRRWPTSPWPSPSPAVVARHGLGTLESPLLNRPKRARHGGLRTGVRCAEQPRAGKPSPRPRATSAGELAPSPARRFRSWPISHTLRELRFVRMGRFRRLVSTEPTPPRFQARQRSIL